MNKYLTTQQEARKPGFRCVSLGNTSLNDSECDLETISKSCCVPCEASMQKAQCQGQGMDLSIVEYKKSIQMHGEKNECYNE
jgi:hypothetical protein